jgi:hypothetical protein
MDKITRLKRNLHTGDQHMYQEVQRRIKKLNGKDNEVVTPDHSKSSYLEKLIKSENGKRVEGK